MSERSGNSTEFRKQLIQIHFEGSVNFLWQRTKPIIVGWFAGRTSKNDSECDNCLNYCEIFRVACIHNLQIWSRAAYTTWRAAGWRPMILYSLKYLFGCLLQIVQKNYGLVSKWPQPLTLHTPWRRLANGYVQEGSLTVLNLGLYSRYPARGIRSGIALTCCFFPQLLKIKYNKLISNRG